MGDGSGEKEIWGSIGDSRWNITNQDRVYKSGCGVTTHGGWGTGTDYSMRNWDVPKGKYYCIGICSGTLVTHY